jgi:endonuclease III
MIVDRGSEGRAMRKALPSTMFVDTEQSRLSMLRNWVLDYEVTEIEMNERQFWNFAHLQPVAEKPWITFMGRPICVPNMPEDAQKCLGFPANGATRQILPSESTSAG